jgi:hypothetical protein
MIGVGSVGVVAGATVAMGCLNDESDGRCPAQPSGLELGVGIPVMAIGAALLTYGLVQRPRPTRFVEPNAPTPMPDPFVKPLQSPNRSPLSRSIK